MDNDDRAHDRSLDRDGLAGDPVEVRAEDVRVHRVADDVGIREARSAYGGIDIPAALAGALSALGTSVLLGAGLAGAGALRYGEGAVDDRSLRTGAVIAGLLAAAVAAAVGAWVAGRMSRYDGGRNGLLSSLLFVLALAGISAAGLGLGDAATGGDVGANLSDWWNADAFGPLGLAGAIGSVLLLLLIGWLFGRLGARYHRKADELIVNTREGGLGRTGGIARTGGLTTGSGSDRGSSTLGSSASGITGAGPLSRSSRDLSDLDEQASRDRERS